MKARSPALQAPLLLAFALSVLGFGAGYAQNPPTEKKPVTDEFHGVRVEDDYVITSKGLERVSTAPREIAEIEAEFSVTEADGLDQI